MTLTQRTDGDSGASYLELADLLQARGSRVERRVVRRLQESELSLAIDEVETACDVSIARDACAAYGLSKADADAIVARTREAVSSWRDEATRLRIPRAEQDFMAAAFEA